MRCVRLFSRYILFWWLYDIQLEFVNIQEILIYWLLNVQMHKISGRYCYLVHFWGWSLGNNKWGSLLRWCIEYASGLLLSLPKKEAIFVANAELAWWKMISFYRQTAHELLYCQNGCNKGTLISKAIILLVSTPTLSKNSRKPKYQQYQSPILFVNNRFYILIETWPFSSKESS